MHTHPEHHENRRALSQLKRYVANHAFAIDSWREWQCRYPHTPSSIANPAVNAPLVVRFPTKERVYQSHSRSIVTGFRETTSL